MFAEWLGVHHMQRAGVYSLYGLIVDVGNHTLVLIFHNRGSFKTHVAHSCGWLTPLVPLAGLLCTLTVNAKIWFAIQHFVPRTGSLLVRAAIMGHGSRLVVHGMHAATHSMGYGLLPSLIN